MKTKLSLLAIALFSLQMVYGQGVFFEKTVTLSLKNINTSVQVTDTIETKQIFLRYHLTGPAFDFKNNYSQIQVGYSWDIMSKINSEYNKK